MVEKLYSYLRGHVCCCCCRLRIQGRYGLVHGRHDLLRCRIVAFGSSEAGLPRWEKFNLEVERYILTLCIKVEEVSLEAGPCTIEVFGMTFSIWHAFSNVVKLRTMNCSSCTGSIGWPSS